MNRINLDTKTMKTLIAIAALATFSAPAFAESVEQMEVKMPADITAVGAADTARAIQVRAHCAGQPPRRLDISWCCAIVHTEHGEHVARQNGRLQREVGVQKQQRYDHDEAPGVT